MAARKKVTKKVSKSGSKGGAIRSKRKSVGDKAIRSRAVSPTRSVKLAKTKKTITKADAGKAKVRSAKPKIAAIKSKAAVVDKAAKRAKTVKAGVAKVSVPKPNVAKANVAKSNAVKPSGVKTSVLKANVVKANVVKVIVAKPAAPKSEIGAEKPVSNAIPTTTVDQKVAIKATQPKETTREETRGAEPALKRTASATMQAPAGTATIAPTADVAKAPTPVLPVASPVADNAARSPKAAPPVKTNDREPLGGEQKTMKNSSPKHGFKLNEYVVYPAHGVGQIVSLEEQEVAGFRLELFVINFVKDKMTLRVPTSKVTGVGMRKLSDPEGARRSLEILTGRARIKRTMWSRRAQEYEAKINSGDINAIAEVVRDLFRSEAQPEQSYSERQLYEAALDRMMREIAAVQKISETEALKVIDTQLRKNQKRGVKPDGLEGAEAPIEEAA